MRYFLPIILSISVTFGVVAKGKKSNSDRPRAFLKVEYDEIHYLEGKNDSIVERTNKAILLVANGASQFYDPQTFYVDSLINDPIGCAARDAVMDEAFAEMHRSGKSPFDYMRERGFMGDSDYRNEKDFNTGVITAVNSNGADYYRYPVEMSDLEWELGDSIKNIMGYECQMAEADYHGRHWIAWFSSEIPIQEGPWQLCGLPGLIMSAKTADMEYEFRISGLQETSENFKPYYNEEKCFSTKRKSYWKMKDYARRNRSSQIAAMTGGAVKPSENVNFTGGYDYIETDYHE